MNDEFCLYDLCTTPPIDFLNGRFEQIILPTEVVLRSLGPITPRFARVYYTELFVLKTDALGVNQDLPSEVLVHNNDLRKTAHLNLMNYHDLRAGYDSVKLIEFFENRAEDGHVDFILQGWIFVRASELTEHFYINWNDPLFQKIQNRFH